jgi:hypothetical protein
MFSTKKFLIRYAAMATSGFSEEENCTTTNNVFSEEEKHEIIASM